MRRELTVVAVIFLTANPVFAVSDGVEAGIGALKEIAVDPAKLSSYCRLSKELGIADEKEDEAKYEALDAEMGQFLKGLGPRFESAWTLGEELEPGSEDSEALEEAFAELEGKCQE